MKLITFCVNLVQKYLPEPFVLAILLTLIAALTAGKMSYVADGKTVEREIHGGVADVKDNVVSVCLY